MSAHSDRPLRIGIDLDGVMCDFNTSFITLIKDQTGIQLPPVSDTYPDCWNYHRAGGVTKDQDNKLWDIVTDDGRQFWKRLGGLPGALYLRRLADLMEDGKIVVYFITTRPGNTAHQQSMKWLRDRGFWIPAQVLIAGSEAAKGLLAKGLDLDVFLDDKPENCIAVAGAAERCQVSILTTPYNRTLKFFKVARVQSVREWLEGLELVAKKPSLLQQAMNEQKAA